MLEICENAVRIANPLPPRWGQHEGADWAGSASGFDPPPRRRRRQPAKRGTVQGFSHASRRRLRRLLATVRWAELGQAHFLTLTFHRVPDDWHRRFAVWLHARRRDGARYLWRVELQQRGAPHWHVILWAPAAALDRAREHWHELAALGSRAHRRHGWHVTTLDSYRQAAAYVSKYVAKVQTVEHAALDRHRHWGASRDLPTSPHAVADLTDAQFYALRRVARRLIRSRNRRRRARALSPFSVFLFLPRAAGERLASWLGVELEPPPPPPSPPPRAPDRAAVAVQSALALGGRSSWGPLGVS